MTEHTQNSLSLQEIFCYTGEVTYQQYGDEMRLEDGDRVLLNGFSAEIVGVRYNGYDVVRYTDSKVIRNVSETELVPC